MITVTSRCPRACSATVMLLPRQQSSSSSYTTYRQDFLCPSHAPHLGSLQIRSPSQIPITNRNTPRPARYRSCSFDRGADLFFCTSLSSCCRFSQSACERVIVSKGGDAPRTEPKRSFASSTIHGAKITHSCFGLMPLTLHGTFCELQSSATNPENHNGRYCPCCPMSCPLQTMATAGTG